MGIYKARGGIGRSRARNRERRAHAPRCAGIAVCNQGRALFVADEQMANAPCAQHRVVDVDI